MTVIYAIVIFLLLIFIHEFGHFIAAKLCNVKVNEFALGMGTCDIQKAGKRNPLRPAHNSDRRLLRNGGRG